MKSLLCLLTILLASLTAAAHPGIGIVQDSRGNVFFTDLKQVWKIAPDGKKSVAVPNVHTHELSLDNDDNLFGEHLWYEGERTDKWGHRVWCLKRDGALVDVIPAREGFLQNYSFVRDHAGNHYFTELDKRNVIKKRTPDGRIVPHATGEFRDLRWMTATADGAVWLVADGNLYRIQPNGTISTVARRLSETGSASAAEPNYQMGLWLDASGNVYVAVQREFLVLKVQPDGKFYTVMHTPRPWAPSGGLVDRQGNFWLLEFDNRNEVRVRRVSRNGAEQIF